jgi:hypothetical protein
MDHPFHFNFSNVRVVDMNDYVYESNLNSPLVLGTSYTGGALWYNAPPSINDPLAPYVEPDVLSISVNAVSDQNDPIVIYAYLLSLVVFWRI